MKRKSGVLSLILMFLVLGCLKPGVAQDTQTKTKLESDYQKESYAVGFRTGLRLYGMVQNNDIDRDVAMQGIRDALSRMPQLPPEELQKLYAGFKDRLAKRQSERDKTRAQKNKMAGERFLEAISKREGVITTASGLRYRVLKEGTGPVPGKDSIAVIHYRGTLVDGTEVFNTYKRGEPIKLPLERSLPAWKEALRLMKTGSKFVLFIPPDLAYKDHGKPPAITPNSVLIYEAELLAIE